MTMLARGYRLLRVIGPSPKDPEILFEVVMAEAPLRREMFDYSWRILNLSPGISIFTAALVYLSLHLLMVRTMRRITENKNGRESCRERGCQYVEFSGGAVPSKKTKT